MRSRTKRVLSLAGDFCELTKRERRRQDRYHLIPEESEYAREFMTKGFTDMENRNGQRLFRGQLVNSHATRALFSQFGKMEFNVLYIPLQSKDKFLIVSAASHVEERFQRSYYSHYLWVEGQKPFKEFSQGCYHEGPLLWVPIHGFKVLEENQI